RAPGSHAARHAVVALDVDEDFASACALRKRRGVAIRRIALHRESHRLGEGLGLAPARVAADRDDDVQPLAAGRFDERHEAERGEAIAYLLRAIDHASESQ